MVRFVSSAVVLSVFLLASISAHANSGDLMTFQGLGDLQPVGNFYNGSGPFGTPNFGVTFSSNFFGLRSVFNGGGGNFSATPTGTPAIFVNGTTGMSTTGMMNVNAGFSNGINFFYTAGFTSSQNEVVKVWSGANGTGTVLATIVLANNNGGCSAPLYCNWSDAVLGFSGTAKSVTFTGPANEIGFADITIGSNTTALPEPSSIYLLGTGLAGISIAKVRRFFRL